MARVDYMHLKKSYDKRSGRTYLSIVHGYRDTDGKSKSKVIESLGYLDILEKKYADPITHFTNRVQSMEVERKESKTVTIAFDMGEELERNIVMRKNYGSVVFSRVYHDLEIDRFLNNARRHEKFRPVQ